MQLSFIIRLEAGLQQYIGIHFTARFGCVHAYGCNSAESEPIWMKSGAHIVGAGPDRF